MPMRRGPRGFGGGPRRGPGMFGPRPGMFGGPRRRMPPPPPPMFGPRPYRRRRSGCGCLPLFLMALPLVAIAGLFMLML